jgi:hypothetical protein
MARFRNVRPGWSEVAPGVYEDPATGDRFEAKDGHYGAPFTQTRVVADGIVSDWWTDDTLHRPAGLFQIRAG